MHCNRAKDDGHDRRNQGRFRWLPGRHYCVSEATSTMDQAAVQGEDRRQPRRLENRARGMTTYL